MFSNACGWIASTNGAEMPFVWQHFRGRSFYILIAHLNFISKNNSTRNFVFYCLRNEHAQCSCHSFLFEYIWPTIDGNECIHNAHSTMHGFNNRSIPVCICDENIYDGLHLGNNSNNNNVLLAPYQWQNHYNHSNWLNKGSASLLQSFKHRICLSESSIYKCTRPWATKSVPFSVRSSRKIRWANFDEL